MKKFKRISALFALCCLLVGAVGYFATYPLMIGSPIAADIKYWDAEHESTHQVSVTGEQLSRLTGMLRQTAPIVFPYDDRPGIGNEEVLITLHYGEGKPEEFSLWFGKRILYAGDAEDLTMSCMLGDLLHFGGILFADIDEFLNELTR